MYSYIWDAESGGILLTSSPQSFSMEPRPVYSMELDALGFGDFFSYAHDEKCPYMWSEANKYFYRGQLLAKTKAGSFFTKPELEIAEYFKNDRKILFPIDVECMVRKNSSIIESLTQETIKKVYNTYIRYKEKIDIFYVAFSGGKDSITVLDIVQRALPHNAFKVVFGDTGMEFSDTYNEIDFIEDYCRENGIDFLRAKSDLSVEQTWKTFGPPAVTNRWCCSVHKTSPQIRLLQNITGKSHFTGMAFTGVRGSESLTRSEYDDITIGGKHQGQFSFHPLLDWNSAELFLYIYANKLHLNEAYKKGNSRAGCLVCPMSSGRHEYLKYYCYGGSVNKFLQFIKDTRQNTGLTDIEMKKSIDEGCWKTRKTGRMLNFGYDKHQVIQTKLFAEIHLENENMRWKEWAKTIGTFIEIDEEHYTIDFNNKCYHILKKRNENHIVFSFPYCTGTKDEIKFLSLFRSVIIKSLYCVNCGVCIAECSSGCIDMTNGLSISDGCSHCYQCHAVHEHCLRYNSIRNRVGGDTKVKGLDRYFSFGVKEEWLSIFANYQGKDDFWKNDGDGKVANKKKDAFLHFVKDAEIVTYNKTKVGDKYTKYEPTNFFLKISKYGANSPVFWAFLLCNLVYTPQFNWYVKNINLGDSFTQEQLKLKLESVMENDEKGLGRRNIADAFKNILVKTPLGKDIGLGDCDYIEKTNSSGSETIKLNSVTRRTWENPESLVILYSLYRFAEECGGYYQFTLSRLADFSIESEGVSPMQIFGINTDVMKKILSGLASKYADYISVSFTLDLDTINLREDKKSSDVLELL